MAKTPIPLEHYDFLAALELWRAAGMPGEYPRFWELESPGRDQQCRHFVIRLRSPGQVWLRTIMKVAPSVAEAVWLAMEEWNRTSDVGAPASPEAAT